MVRIIARGMLLLALAVLLLIISFAAFGLFEMLIK